MSVRFSNGAGGYYGVADDVARGAKNESEPQDISDQTLFYEAEAARLKEQRKLFMAEQERLRAEIECLEAETEKRKSENDRLVAMLAEQQDRVHGKTAVSNGIGAGCTMGAADVKVPRGVPGGGVQSPSQKISTGNNSRPTVLSATASKPMARNGGGWTFLERMIGWLRLIGRSIGIC
ncbi:MAG: hypothetical protein LBI34_01935 [Puniceicoccales bacterium]|jgi:hypothetical protein|nr:hypothetical protein [Puniceicoccales bacterium]